MDPACPGPPNLRAKPAEKEKEFAASRPGPVEPSRAKKESSKERNR